MAQKITYSGSDVTVWKEGYADNEEYQKAITAVRKALDKRKAKYDETDRGNRYIFSEKNN